MHTRRSRTAVFAVSLLALGTPAAAYAGATDDLRAQIKALEARVEQLETQRGASPPPSVAPAESANPAVAPAAAGGPEPAGGVSAGGKLVKPGAITPGERQQLPAPAAPSQPDNGVTGGEFPGSFKLPGSKTSLGIHGWMDLQAFYDTKQYLGDKFQVGSILPYGDVKNQLSNSYHFQGKLTRFIVESRTPTPYGRLRTYLATDFYGYENGGSTGQQAIQNNNYSLRVVHAFGQLGPFLAGKTWSNFIDDPDSLESLDNAGASGVPSEQVLQLRYTRETPFGDFSVSAENPVTDYASSAKAGANELTSIFNPVPDFTAKYEVQRPWGHIQASGVLRQLAYDDGAGHRSRANAGGGIFGGTLTMPLRSALGGQVWFGNGIMKFTPDDFGPVSSAQIDNIGTAQQRLVPSNENGLTVFAAHQFSPELRTNIGYGYNSMHWDAFIPPDVSEPEITHTLHANVIWSPVPPVDFGFEFIHGLKTFRRELGLAPSTNDRYESAFKFKF